MNAAYPAGSARALLASPLVSGATVAAMNPRLDVTTDATVVPRFFDPAAFVTLTAVCARLLPPDAPVSAPAAARGLDDHHAEGRGNGWRYSSLPADGESLRRGLRGLDESAAAGGMVAFTGLTPVQQDAILAAVQRGEGRGETWHTLDGRRWFEELLADVTELYASHPLVQERIGYAGFADAAGWGKIGLNERESWEPAAGAAEFTMPATRPELAGGRETPSPPMRRYPETEVVDAVVIGTGAGGGPLLARLAQAGLRVVALEAGRFWDPARDFATDEKAQGKLFWNDERLSAGADPLAFGNNNSGIGVGGSTLHYTAYTPRPQPDDLRLRTDSGAGVDWPLSYGELEPYFDELETLLGISGPSPYPWGPPRRRGYPLAPLPLNAAAQLMQRACAGLGIRTAPAANAALSAPYFQPGVGHRPACTNRGFCQAGCTTGAKASVDVVFIPLALAAGAEVRTEAFVTRIERDARGRVSAVIYTQAGQERRQRCQHVFLCAGAVETPRLLLINDGLANGSGQVGRNFMAHTGVQLWGEFAEETRPFKGIPGGLISEDTHRPADADFTGGYLLQSIGVMPVTYASQLARSPGAPFGAALGARLGNYNHVAGINILGDCLPSPGNFLELSDERDSRGLPKPRVHFTAGENERRMTAHAERLMREIWSAAGAREPWAFPRYAHVIGTCRMGNDPANSVVDADGRAWDVPGLFICDNSVFPSALAANPALTIMALSRRTADRFLTTHKP